MFYTYAYLREDKPPYYIGKGKGRRISCTNHRVAIPPEERRIYLKQNLTEEEAFRHEVYMIALYGRKDLGTGILVNMSDGGEGPTGNKWSEDRKKKLSETTKGRPKSEEWKALMKERMKGVNKGKKRTPEQLEARRKLMTGKKRGPYKKRVVT